MPTTTLPHTSQKADGISRRIANARPPHRDRLAPEGQVSGGFNHMTHHDVADQPRPQENSATAGDGQ